MRLRTDGGGAPSLPNADIEMGRGCAPREPNENEIRCSGRRGATSLPETKDADADGATSLPKTLRWVGFALRANRITELPTVRPVVGVTHKFCSYGIKPNIDRFFAAFFARS